MNIAFGNLSVGQQKIFVVNSMCFCILLFAFQIQAGLTCDDEFSDDSLNSLTAFKPMFMGT